MEGALRGGVGGSDGLDGGCRFGFGARCNVNGGIGCVEDRGDEFSKASVCACNNEDLLLRLSVLRVSDWQMAWSVVAGAYGKAKARLDVQCAPFRLD